LEAVAEAILEAIARKSKQYWNPAWKPLECIEYPDSHVLPSEATLEAILHAIGRYPGSHGEPLEASLEAGGCDPGSNPGSHWKPL
jgi:hypothetical protein